MRKQLSSMLHIYGYLVPDHLNILPFESNTSFGLVEFTNNYAAPGVGIRVKLIVCYARYRLQDTTLKKKNTPIDEK